MSRSPTSTESPPAATSCVIDYSRQAPFLEHRVRAATMLAYLPIVMAVLFCAAWSLCSLFTRLTMNHAQTPWESAIICDAWRAATGQPVYESLQRGGHATHLYGALTSQTLGVIFRVLGGPNIYAGRLLTLLAAVVTCVIAMFAFIDRRRLYDWIVGIGLFITLHYRCRAYFVETRPDMIGLMFAAIALCFFYRAQRGAGSKRQVWWYVPGILAIALAFFFKQTYAAFAAVPVVVSVMRWRSHFLRRSLFAASPLVVLVAVYFTLKLFAPNVFFYMIAEAAMYKIPPARVVLGIISVTTLSPLFFILLTASAMQPENADPIVNRAERDRRDRATWLLIASSIGAAAGTLAFAKRGGSYNSLLLGWVPMTIFVAANILPITEMIAGMFAPRGPAVPTAVGAIFGGLIVVTTFAVPSSDKWNWQSSHGGNEYPAVVKAAAALDGRVVCPDDPAIPLIAKRQLGRSLEAELDANGRVGFSQSLINEIKNADWFIGVHAQYDDGRFSPAIMHKWGFRQVNSSDAPFNQTYSLWRHDLVALPSPPTTSAADPAVKSAAKKKRRAPDRS